MSTPIQKIYFGCPGTGKSHKIENQDLKNLRIGINSSDHIHTVFHPEYSFGDFIGKLVPISRAGKVEYKFRSGHFLTALGQAYKNIKDADELSVRNTVLVIDEINRGNCAAIFGSVFQLLDRDENGWSTYAITLNEIEFEALLRNMGYEIGVSGKGEPAYFTSDGKGLENIEDELNKVKVTGEVKPWSLSSKQDQMKIKIPPNLSIIASMNTSDNSVYLMDSAFKRRWGWEFLDWENVYDEDERCLGIKPNSIFYWFEKAKPTVANGENNYYRWAPTSMAKASFIVELNRFIKSHHESIRGIEDKQIGPFFIPTYVKLISKSGADNSLENKVMHFIWDTVFQRDKKPLLDLINEYRQKCTKDSQLRKSDLVTFGDFQKHTENFVHAIMMPRYYDVDGKLCETKLCKDILYPVINWYGRKVFAVECRGKLVPVVQDNVNLIDIFESRRKWISMYKEAFDIAPGVQKADQVYRELTTTVDIDCFKRTIEALLDVRKQFFIDLVLGIDQVIV